ncbi:MAG TPA: hypothetical protein VFW53_10925 [Gallionella sp.]|nr:hypothetical protein [Gallionella sp.]
MKNRNHFRLTHTKALKNSHLQISYADGAEFDIDLSDWIKSSACLKPLQDPRLFATAKLSEFGRAVEFGKGEIDLAADNLRNLATEQSGGIGHERIWNWMHGNNLTLDAAAEVLGISRRMLAYYRNGEKTIPRHIWLACVGWETLHKHGEAA